MPSYDHTELLATVRTMLETNDEKHLTWCIEQCHNGRLHSPINQQNLHLFRRYRNDPKNGSGSAPHMIEEAKRDAPVIGFNLCDQEWPPESDNV